MTATISDVKIRAATESDLIVISEFICRHFNHHEPIQMFHVRKEEEMDPPPLDLLQECIESQTLLLAYVGDELLGVAIAGEITPEAGERDLEMAANFNPKGSDVFEMLAYISEKADLCNKLGVSKCLHLHILSVHRDHLCQGIGQRLFKSCIDLGEAKNFPSFSVDCTNFYTSLIAEKNKMICLSTITYDEYNEHLGKILFVAREPHTEIKSYAKLYE